MFRQVVCISLQTLNEICAATEIVLNPFTKGETLKTDTIFMELSF